MRVDQPGQQGNGPQVLNFSNVANRPRAYFNNPLAVDSDDTVFNRRPVDGINISCAKRSQHCLLKWKLVLACPHVKRLQILESLEVAVFEACYLIAN